MDEHYQNLAKDFNDAWKFSEGYKSWAVDKIGSLLEINHNDRFVDIGGGTGTFTNMIHQQFNPIVSYCVEPSPEMCNIAKEHMNITTICGDAFNFIHQKIPYSKMLFKEVIHHIEDRISLWKAIEKSIPDSGKILIYTRPQDIKFPLFQKAKEAFKKNQPNYEEIIDELTMGGLKTAVYFDSYTFKLPKEKWHSMLRTRFMSDLSIFSDEEIVNGIAEISIKNDKEYYILEDEIVFIIAYK